MKNLKNCSEKHLRLLEVAKILGVTTQTLRAWDKSKKIKVIRTPGGQRRIPLSEVERILGLRSNEEDNKIT